MEFQIAPNHPLVGAVSKIERANQHIRDFNEKAKRFLDQDDLFSFEAKESPYPGFHYLTLIDMKPIPRELPLVIGDAVHNLRSALDLLACQLVRLKLYDDDCRRVSFPIAENLEKFPSALSANRIKLADDKVLKVIDTLQPYGGGKMEDLWKLHRLDIQDKHRLLLVATASFDKWRMETMFTPDDPKTDEPIVMNVGDDQPFPELVIPKIGDALLVVDTDRLSRGEPGNLHLMVKLNGNIAFNEPGILQCSSAVDALVRFANAVIDTIGLFEPFFPAIRN